MDMLILLLTYAPDVAGKIVNAYAVLHMRISCHIIDVENIGEVNDNHLMEEM